MSEPTWINVTFGDCDPAGIVFYPNIFRWMDRAFYDALRPFGGHGAVAEALGALGLGIMESRAQFRRPIRDGDTVAIHLTIAEWGRRSVTLDYEGSRNGETVMTGCEVRGVFMRTADGIVAGEVAGLRKMLERARQMDETEARQASGTQSVDAALELLQVMAGYGGPVSLSELARTCDMQPSKVHRYLASFVKANLAAQTGRSGKYMLGPGAMQLGLAAIGQHDFVNHAAEGMADLCNETGMTALLTVWGNQGATVVRWERAPSPTVTSMGLGTTLPLLNSASGRIFLAWGPAGAIRAAREKELRRAKRMPQIVPDMEPTAEGVERLVQTIRAHGYASVHGDFIPGLVAIAAPILDWQEEAQAAITLIGTDVAATEPSSDPVLRLIAYCRQRSVLLPPRRTGTAS